MYKPNLITLLLITLLSFGQAQACPKGAMPEASIKDIQVEAINNFVLQEKEVVILDVRTPEEYTTGHIEGAININVSDDTFSQNIAKLDRDKTYIVHCGANVKGGRTDQSFKIMTDLGFNKLRNMAGGIVAWEANGLPLNKGLNTSP